MNRKSGFSYTQVGYIPMLIALALLFADLYFIYFVGVNVVFLILLPVFAFVGIIFSSLHVEINNTTLSLELGRLFTREILLSEIAAYENNPVKLYTVWGVNILAHGTIFSVAGFESVKITMNNGREYVIGCPAPEEFIAALDKHKKDHVIFKD
jgi:hypothetical protein